MALFSIYRCCFSLKTGHERSVLHTWLWWIHHSGVKYFQANSRIVWLSHLIQDLAWKYCTLKVRIHSVQIRPCRFNLMINIYNWFSCIHVNTYKVIITIWYDTKWAPKKLCRAVFNRSPHLQGKLHEINREQNTYVIDN